MKSRAESRVLLALIGLAGAFPTHAAEPCGDVISLETHGRTTTRYALVRPQGAGAPAAPIALVLLVGGSGHLNLDPAGCPRELRGNSLVRSLPLFHEAGFVTALVDAPSDHTGADGLGGFRIASQHAEDLGKVIADLRERAKVSSVWVVGTSRGTISAVNAASRLSGPAQPDGVVLTSALMVGTVGGRLSWTAHTVFDLPLDAIRQPVLVVGHEADACLRSPATLMGRIVEKTKGARQQMVLVTGGPGGRGLSDLAACEGRSPHGFLGQEAEVAAGIARFVRGGAY